MLLSIIVPVYNVEEYLVTCIQSLLDQDIANNSYEIMAVNDGSTDHSLSVLEKLKEKHPHILKIVSQENQGLSGARNTGMQHAQGTYLLFVDSDDTLAPRCLGSLMELMVTNNLDLLEFGAQGITPHKKVVFTVAPNSHGAVMDGTHYLASVKFIGSACNKVYRSGFLRQHQLQFMPKVYIEDIEFNTRAIFRAQRIMAIPNIGAYFLQRTGSITRNPQPAKVKKMIYDILTVLTAINSFTEELVTPSSPAYLPLKKKVSSLIATMLLRVFKQSKDPILAKDVLGKLKEHSLYPTAYPAEDVTKNIFLAFANTEKLFVYSLKLQSRLNSTKHGA